MTQGSRAQIIFESEEATNLLDAQRLEAYLAEEKLGQILAERHSATTGYNNRAAKSTSGVPKRS